ncbi:serine/threonine-protein kinase N1-like [Xenopus laevis]|uniref:non-specific serine/threonine protein kinase n=1 Tax=Xenopus laevis TaxID=8355 RepID=A0A8J1KS23_XENLA|nr:serine/threonine-protein kinase N1-like [Xenopus laevis]
MFLSSDCFILNSAADPNPPNTPLSVPDRLAASGPIVTSQGQKEHEAECEEISKGILQSVPAPSPSSSWQPIDCTSDEQPSRVSISHFQLSAVLGQGGFGKVYLGKYKATGKLFAIKTLKKREMTSSIKLNSQEAAPPLGQQTH